MSNLYDDYKEEKKEKVLYDTNNVSNKNNRKDNLKKINKNQKLVLINKLEKVFPNLQGLTIGILGLTFKPGTDDLREAPSIDNIKYLLKQGVIIKAYDPIGINNFKKVLSFDTTLDNYLDNITYYDNIDDTIKDSDACLIMTEWKDIKEYPLNNYEKLMNSPIIFDGRNCYDLDNVKKYNIYYNSIGRCLLRKK